jgi:hypothetical protein
MDIDRRRFLGLLAGSTVVGFGVLNSAVDASAEPLPGPHPWRPLPGEVEPAVKARATGLIEAVGTWTGGRGAVADARRRVVLAGHDPGLATALGALLSPALESVIRVRDAQYGGLLGSAASVLVVVDQWWRQADGSVRAGGTTVDIRLVRASPRWRVVDAFPAEPRAPVRHVSSSAERVLTDSRITLPSAAAADVRAERIHNSVLTWLTALAANHVVDVSVLQSGHPLHVFGTTRMSDHPRGRAVDVWALDGRPLVAPSNHDLAVFAMRHAVAHGAYNVGGPVRLTGKQYFSDRTHQDHVHVGFAA